MKKVIAVFLVTILAVSNLSFKLNDVFAFDRNYEYLNDPTIFGEGIANTYVGKTENSDKIQNLNFNDISASPYAESIVRMGAFDIIKGSSNLYRPFAPVSNEETLTFLVRMSGMEREALTAAETIRTENTSLNNLWSLGYLNVAMQIGLIDQRAYNQSLATDQASLDPATSFLRGGATTREQLAVWVYDMLMIQDPTLFPLDETVQSVFTFNDYGNISVENIQKIEAITSSGIMDGTSTTNFSPNGIISRGEVAQVLANIDQYYYNNLGYVEKRGTVGGIIKENQENPTIDDRNTDIYVRDSYGIVNVLRNYFNNDLSPQNKSMDAPVYIMGRVYGLTKLQPDDTIEYIVNEETKEIVYVQVIQRYTAKEKLEAKLLNIDFENNSITVVHADESRSVFPVALSSIGPDYLVIDGKEIYIGSIPIGSSLELTLLNNVVMDMSYVGEDTIIYEFRGVVLENNPQLGYMIVIDNNGVRHNMKYYDDDITVEKQQYYDIDDEIGYIDEVFPNFKYDPRDSQINEVEVGDIVFIKPFKDDPTVIERISATTNYIMKYGQIKQIIVQEYTTNVLVEYENGTTSYYEIPNNAPITKNGKFLNRNDIMVGDYAKFLINQAIISPGYIEESVKEVVVEGSANYVNSIVKGNVIGYDAIQNKLLIDNTRVLTAGNWSNYNGIESFEINRNVEIYNNGERVTIDYLNRYLREGTAYVAIQNNYSGEQVKKVTVYNGRDQLLGRDTVVDSSATGDFILLNSYRNITSDPGTIVVRHGRLVDNNNIQSYDYGTVALNGGNHAAVVEIVDKPNNGGKMIARGRILSVDEGDNFTVKSMAVLESEHTEWIYTPVERQFEIDNNTVFLINGSVMPFNEFIGYTRTTQIDKVYNIVSDGVYAELVSDSAYATYAIRGTVYKTEGDTVYLRDVLYKENDTNDWDTLSDLNNTAVVNVPFNSITMRNGEVIQTTDLVIGEQVLVMTSELPEQKNAGMRVNGIIITVEKY